MRYFSEGLALARRGDSWGFIDRAGRTVIPFEYAYASSFSEGLAAVTVSRDRKVPGWGYINREGKVVIPTIFDYATPFDGGLAAIDRITDEQNVTDAYIDTRGRIIWEKPQR